FMDILTLAVSTPVESGLTRTLTLKSTTRLTETRSFIGSRPYLQNHHRAVRSGQGRAASHFSGSLYAAFIASMCIRMFGVAMILSDAAAAIEKQHCCSIFTVRYYFTYQYESADTTTR